MIEEAEGDDASEREHDDESQSEDDDPDEGPNRASDDRAHEEPAGSEIEQVNCMGVLR